MATRQKRELDNPLPREVFTKVSMPASPTVTGRQWDLRPPAPIEPLEPRPVSIYDRNAATKEKTDDATIGKKEGTLLLLVLAPILICIVLVLWKPIFVTENSQEGVDSKLQLDKVLLWTLMISVVVWIMIYGFRFCKCNQN